MWEKIKKFFSGNTRKSVYKGKLILVVDDGEIERRTAQSILENSGYRVVCATGGREGIDLAHAEKPDLILMDCIMPDIVGPEVCKILKTNSATKDIPVIFLTGSDTPSNIVKCYDMGAELFLTKPVTPKILIDQIETVFNELDVKVQ